MTKSGPGTRDTRQRIVLMLAMLVPAPTLLASDAAAGPRDNDPPEQAEGRMDGLVEELARALGMTPAEIEALGLSPAELERLLAGFTEDAVVVGFRAQPRSATESAVPVDVLSATDLVSQGAGDLKDQLRTLIPSFSANTQPISGVSTVVRPAMLRNLAPDHTLVLINGKRRHPGRSSTGKAAGWPTGRRGLTSRPFPRSRCGESRCCATAQRRSTARTPSPGC